METIIKDAEDQVALKMVRMGYATDEDTDQYRVLTFSARFNRKPLALDALRSIGQYNGFDGEAVAQALDNVVPDDAYSPITVGREMSPVVYVSTIGVNGADTEAVKSALRDVGADEIDEDRHSIRAWWD